VQTGALLTLLSGKGIAVPLIAFLLTGIAVFFIASRLARHADAIADATGLGRLWIGTLLLAASTSLPELITDVNAALLGAVDIGIGDLFGSTLANMLILAVLNLWYWRRHVLSQVKPDHVVTGTLAIALTAIAGAAIASGGWGTIGHVGIETLFIMLVYLFGMRAVYHSISVTAPPEQLELGESGHTVLRDGLIGFALAALGLLITAPLLVLSAQALAAEGGLTETFVGTLLVGFTTSLPEIAATVAAVRLGALDLAVGNILGSNAFNMCILLAMDIAYLPGPVLAHVAQAHVFTAQAAVAMIALAMIGMLGHSEKRVQTLRIVSALLVLIYVCAAWLLAQSGNG
jgi:cation:H+ antiporter